MKKFIRGILASVLFSLTVSGVVFAAEPSMTQPTAAETMIAQGRNFYISGTFGDGEILAEENGVTVSLFPEGMEGAARTVTGSKKNPPLKVNTEVGIPDTWGNPEDLAKSKMPDLIWDGKNEESFYHADSKLYYDDAGFTALVSGGSQEGIVSDGLLFTDDEGNLYSILPEGRYEVWLEYSYTTAESDEMQTYRGTIGTITIGSTPDKIMSRFSPADHMERVTAFAGANGYRIYNDAFAGYWPLGSCEIKTEMRAADIQEYVDGRVHFVIYNVKNTSATYSVELATIQKTESIDDPDRLVNYYYQYGEPALKDGTESEITAFETGDKLQFTRAEITEEGTGDGVYDQDDARVPVYDLNLADGVDAKAGESVSLYGVTAPIQIAAEDMKDNGDNSYTLGNKIQTLKYEISDGEKVLESLDKEVMLNRKSGGWENPSELEFKHEIEVTDEMAGKTLEVKVSGVDAHGNQAAGSDEKFQIRVAAGEEEKEPVPTPPEEEEPAVSPAACEIPMSSAIDSALTAEKLLDANVSEVTVLLKLPAADEHAFTAAREIFEAAQKSGKTVKFKIFDEQGAFAYQWSFDGTKIEKEQMTDVNLLILGSAKDQEAIEKLTGQDQVQYLTFLQEGILPGAAEIVFYTGDCFSAGSEIFLYKYMEEENQLKLISNQVKVSEEQTASFTLNGCSEYVLTKTQAKAETNNPAKASEVKKTPKTGDQSQVVLWSVMLCLAGAAAAAALGKRKTGKN